ncbi:unnamed protein product [Heligmosomoides polygyrus]|uniref:AP2/ERF domain-containing protein n=1 Tax=Heligmosomoides polygyrus TaxID=6339 RepID=A0A183FZB4_HELPZ|nr:unnamed protein product [Heligmosomoides polygyrus]
MQGSEGTSYRAVLEAGLPDSAGPVNGTWRRAAVKRKKEAYKLWQKTRAPEHLTAYWKLKRLAKTAVAKAKNTEMDALYEKLDGPEGEKFAIRLAKARHRASLDIRVKEKDSSGTAEGCHGTSARRKMGTAVMVDSFTGRVTQMDRDRSLITDAKVAPYETVAPQQRPLICILKIAPSRLKQVERCGVPRIKCWRMREKEEVVISRERLPTVTNVDETRKKVTDAIRQVAQSELNITKPGRRKVGKQAWMWTYDGKEKVRGKKMLYHVFLGETTADNWRKYQEAKKAAKKAVAVAKATHYGDVNKKLLSCDGERYLYRLAKNRHRQNEDIEKFFGIDAAIFSWTARRR